MTFTLTHILQTCALEVHNNRAHVTVTQDEGETAATIKINVINIYEGLKLENSQLMSYVN